MTFNKHVRLVVSAELGAVLQRGFTEAIDRGTAPPPLLYVLADGRALRAAVQEGSWAAPDVRFAGAGALEAYALPLLRHFIDERRSREPATAAYRFGDELVRDLHPTGTHFERYVVRFFADADAALTQSGSCQPYALGLRTAELDMAPAHEAPRRTFEVSSAIYDIDVQRRVLDAIFTSFETYYVQADQRFGHANAGQVLASCWDAFRQAVGALLPRFRPPEWASTCEWIATARQRPPERFELVENLLVPALSLRGRGLAPRGLPLERTLVHEALPRPLAADSLRQFYRCHKVRARVVVAAPNTALQGL